VETAGRACARRSRGCAVQRRFLGDGGGDLDAASFMLRVLLDQIVREGGVEEAVDVHVVHDQLVVALVVLATTSC
jgi:hypothetical protein